MAMAANGGQRDNRAAALEARDITRSLPLGRERIDILHGISFRIERGEFVAIIGPSGSGKSTVLGIIAGLDSPTEGQVLVDGVDITKMSEGQLASIRNQKIGMIFQAFNLIPTLTAEENIALPLMLEGKKPAEMKEKVDDLMRRLGMTSRRGHRPDAMSGGEQQRCAIGRALVTEPSVILADEPTGNLDSSNSRAVCELLRDLSVIHNKTIVMVTHEPSVAAYATDVAVLKDGKLVERFAVEEAGNGQGLAMRYAELVGK